MNPEFTHGRPLGPEGPGNEAKREDLREFAEHHAGRSSSSTLGGILALVGAAFVFVATLYSDPFTSGHLLSSIGRALLLWGPVALLLVAGVLLLTSGRLMSAMAGGLAVGVAGVVLLLFVQVLLSFIDFGSPIRWYLCLGLAGSTVALVGGLIAFLAARTKS